MVGVNIESKFLTVRVTRKNESSEVNVETDAATEFQLDGEKATLVDLRPDMHISVTPGVGVAKVVSAKSLTQKEKNQLRKKESAGTDNKGYVSGNIGGRVHRKRSKSRTV